MARSLDTASKFVLFSVSGLKDKNLIKKQTYTKTETCKLYSRAFWTFQPNSSKSILITLTYTVSKLAHFLRHNVYAKGHMYTNVKRANLEETLLIKEPPNVRDNPRPCDKITAYVVIHQQIQIPLPKPCFLSSATTATITSIMSLLVIDYHWSNYFFI